ncbi:UDP-N-acetylmuramate dehydrogenase [Allostreptomyces psammosilenae]|uniref:UDP-N-acetylenolpyruvoylglucosamine reductase n=1 Tax=Allostreptomyces psammosilenae TaxID=1892865 RepID=A0A852ZYU4_9ACTN|nr:UDP-N-acetylmuramate dehydrogenase [Allostreptomyces psammosilenae]NYI05884.1 UDP-N-acetylmuramate dehydrogenase [Allostreptomyces psammosilenae]
MQVLDNAPLAPLTTFRLGGPARRLVVATTEEEVTACARRADAAGEPLLPIGGGSNLLVGDDGFDGTALRIATRGIRIDGTTVTVAAGEDWDGVVARTVAAGLAGLEFLSGIPGSAGATPVQNVGAYGQDVSATIVEVTAWDRRTGETVRLDAASCAFAYRHSLFKELALAGEQRYLVLSVTFELERAEGRSAPIRYAEVARALGVEQGTRVELGTARETVLALRRGKGMVLDADDHDTWSAGSFFTNPVLDAEGFAALRERVAARLGDGAEPPAFPDAGGRTKTSAAWLIDRAGFGKGYGDGPARLSTKHVLALTNRGGAKTEDVLALAREVRDGVREVFGVELVNEPVLVGAEL